MGATSMYYLQVFIGITSAFISSNCAKAGHSVSEAISRKGSSGLRTTELKKPQVQNLPQKKPQPLLEMFKFESASFLNSAQKNASQGDETVNDAPSLMKINEDMLSDEATSIQKKLSKQKSIKGLLNAKKTQASAEPIRARSKKDTMKSTSIGSMKNLKRDPTLDRKRSESFKTTQLTSDERIDPLNERTKPEAIKSKELMAEEQLYPLQVTMKSVSDVNLAHLRYYKKPIELPVET
uniref:Uncharacterized protein n=1 Tax=Angiostrongylus cantonensis TaxID=6313 RepID=A0A0K0CVQ7_ANGCA